MQKTPEGAGNQRQSTAPDNAYQVDLHHALHQAIQHVGRISKTKVKGLPYAVISDEAVLAAVREPIIEAGLTFAPVAIEILSDQIIDTGRSRMHHVTLRVQYQVSHQVGESMLMSSIGEAMDASDKAIAKALTMARKSLFRTLFMLESDDPEFERHEPEVPSPF